MTNLLGIILVLSGGGYLYLDRKSFPRLSLTLLAVAVCDGLVLLAALYGHLTMTFITCAIAAITAYVLKISWSVGQSFATTGSAQQSNWRSIGLFYVAVVTALALCYLFVGMFALIGASIGLAMPVYYRSELVSVTTWLRGMTAR